MFRHILVPVDLTTKNSRAVTMAMRLGSPGKSRVTLLHVVELIPGIPFEELKAFYGRLERQAERGMKPLMTRLKKGGYEVGAGIAYGRRVDEILGWAAANRADLLIMSSRRVNLKKPGQEWGTISHKVAILSQCPVLLVR